ncbi:MAG: efflux transporter outer membrane subunit [Hydrogenophaga sp.]|uniref:efflux transporter outer membrane subunit n=1 Tax=Hydrogenophaga sp. TaxID=1904254 RepID=UPI0025C41066|nr:efflux transporter outer membrane subunit [Hydrogenophaga sp.]MBT9551333.1 efflux transporter outer membrane subunit [Hydrogenophaga sp.]
MKTSPLTPAAVAALSVLILAGCSTPAPQAHSPSVALAVSFSNEQPSASVRSYLDEGWWDGFGDATLTQLVNEALSANHDVAIALQRVGQARAGADAQASRLWPTLSLQAAASRSQSGVPEPVKQGMPDTRALRAGLDLAWEIDLAGGVRAARDAARADAAAAAAGVHGARLLVASEVGRQYFILRSAEERLRTVQTLAATQRQTSALVESRVREGLSSAFDLDRARAEADALDAQIPALRMLVGTTQTQLAVLLGRNPSAPVVTTDKAFVWPVPRAIAAGQPSDLLRRRPDLAAAEARVGAEALRSAEARAQWWPKLFLSALVGRQDLRLNALDLAPVHFSNVALALAAPIFNAGRIEAGIQVQSARAEEALLAWQKAVLVAVQEVENSLLVRTQEAERGAALALTAEHRRRSLQRAESLQREGQIDLLVLLDVQRSVLASELALSDSRLQQALADVQLYKALGGGYAPAPTSEPGRVLSRDQNRISQTPLASRTLP